MFATYIYQHSRYLTLFLICTLAVGWNSFQTIPRQEDPTITNFVASITTFYPGATPDRVEALVTKPLEDEIRELPQVEEVFSVSNTGVSSLKVQLKWTLPPGTYEQAWSEVRDAIESARQKFPKGVKAPNFDDDRFRSFTTIVSFSADANNTIPLSIISRLAQNFADKVRNLDNTQQVVTFGDPEEEIRVEVNEAELTSRGLSVIQVAWALESADVKVASGRAIGQGSDIVVELTGSLDTMERIRQVIVNTTPSGSVTRISDLGRVYKTSKTPSSSMAISQGKPAILIGTQMGEATRVDRWSRSFHNLLEEYRREAPQGLKIEVTFNQSDYTSQKLASVAQNLAVGVLLVLLVLLFTLGWRSAVVVAVILPICGFISITIMERVGIVFQQMSITGLIVSLGLLVDGSIVMTDEIRKRLLQGMKPIEAIVGSVNRLRIPLISSALTTILAFLPMSLLPGPPGDFIGSVALAVVIMLMVSTVLALVITPALSALMLPRHAESASHWPIGGVNGGAASKWLQRAILWGLRNPLGSICLALVLPLSGLLALPTVTAQFFPGIDRNQLFVQVKLPDGMSIDHTRKVAKEIDEKLRSYASVTRVDWTIGESPPAFYYNMYRSKEGVPTWAEALVETKSPKLTDDLIRRLQKEMDETFPQALINVRGHDMGPPVGAPIEIEIYGSDLKVLKTLGEEFRLRLALNSLVTHTSADIVGGAPKLVFNIDEERLRLSQLQLADAALALDSNLIGHLGGEVLEGTERLPVRVRLTERDWGTADQIHNIRLPAAVSATNGSGTVLAGISLNTISSMKLVPSQSPITRSNGERLNIVRGFLIRGVLPEEALKLLREDLERNPIVIPDGYRYEFGGDSEERAKVMGELMAPMILVLAAMITVIVVTFNSWSLSFIAILVSICSTGLSLFCLEVFGYPLGIISIMGVLGSIGVSINAAIIIMTALQESPEVTKGNIVAVKNVVMDSSRHIISTTVTTFGGFLPLILEGGEFWPPFAIAIAGGVLLSTIISFFLVPPMFLIAQEKTGKIPVSDGTDSFKEATG